MSSFLVVTIGRAVSSTLAGLGFYAGIRGLPGTKARQSRRVIGSAMVVAVVRRGLFQRYWSGPWLEF